MEREWIGSVISAKARMILLTDGEGGIVHLAAALICAHDVIERLLLDNPTGPLIIKVNSHGDVTKIRGDAELRKRWDQLFQASVIRAKRSGNPVPRRAPEKRRPEAVRPTLPFPEVINKK